MPSDSIQDLLDRAAAAERTGDIAAGLAAYEQALLRLGENPSAMRADVLRHMGSLQRTRGALNDAEELYHISLKISEQIRYREGIAHATNWLAIIAVHRGDLKDAHSRFLQAALLALQIGDRALLAKIEQNLAVIAHTQGDLDAAILRYQSALRNSWQLRDPEMIAGVLNNLGMLYGDLRDYDQADSYFTEAAEVACSAGLEALLNSIALNTAELSAKRRRWAEAAQTGLRTARLARERQTPWLEAEALKVSGMAARAQGHWAEAELDFLSAGMLAAECQDKRLEAQIARELGGTYRMAGRLAEARATLLRALEIFRQIGAGREAGEIEGELETLPTSQS